MAENIITILWMEMSLYVGLFTETNLIKGPKALKIHMNWLPNMPFVLFMIQFVFNFIPQNWHQTYIMWLKLKELKAIASVYMSSYKF